MGCITSLPKLVLDAPDWERKVYEAMLVRVRPSDVADTFVLQFSGCAADSEAMLERITEGVEVTVSGEIRTQNVYDPKPEENRVKVYIYAENITVNETPADDRNKVEICGYICKQPRIKKTHRRTPTGRKVAAASMMVGVNTPKGTYYIPCVCWNRLAYYAGTLNIGEYVEIYGRFQSRTFEKRIKGRELPFVSTAYEVSVVKLKNEKRE